MPKKKKKSQQRSLEDFYVMTGFHGGNDTPIMPIRTESPPQSESTEQSYDTLPIRTESPPQRESTDLSYDTLPSVNPSSQVYPNRPSQIAQRYLPIKQASTQPSSETEVTSTENDPQIQSILEGEDPWLKSKNSDTPSDPEPEPEPEAPAESETPADPEPEPETPEDVPDEPPVAEAKASGE